MSSLSRSLADQLREIHQTDGLPTGRLGEIFEVEPIPLRVFLYDSNYLGLEQQGVELSPIQYEYIHYFECIYNPDTYIALIEQLGDDWIPPRMCHTLTLMAGKGCHAPYTPVYDAETGQWRRLDSFTQPSLVAGAYPSTGLVERFSGTSSFQEGEGEMYRITTSNGLVEDVYGGHKYLKRHAHYTQGGIVKYRNDHQWSKVWDLSVGDHIACSGILPEPSNLFMTSDEIVELVGLYLGDGNLAKSTTSFNICGGGAASLTKQRVVALYEHFEFPYRVQVIPEKNNKWYLYANNPISELPTARELMRQFGLENKYAREKFIPKEFFALPDKQVALLLSRLVDTDGSVYIKKSGTKRTPIIEFSSTSSELTLGVQRLFLRLGVMGRFRRKDISYSYKEGTCTSYTYEITQAKEVIKAGKFLTLLDKQSVLDTVVELAESKKHQRWEHGDLRWDRIVSIEPLGQGPYWTMTVPGPHCYVSSGGFLSSNSGKDLLARLSFARASDLLLNLHSPQTYFGIPSTDEIQMLNVAVSAPQAYRAFFRPLRNLLATSPRFRDQFRGGELPSESAKSILFKKNLELISGHSQAESLEGLNLIAAVADEIAAFKSENELQQMAIGRQSNQTADYIIDMLRSSAATRFPENFKLGIISYPRYEDDAIMQALAKGKADNEKYGERSTHYASGPHVTWDVNPRVSRNSPQIQADYDDDPEYAAAKYECKPPKAVSRFLRSDTAIEQGFSRVEEIPAIEIEYYWGLPKSLPNAHLGEPQEGWQVKFYFSPDFQPMEGAIYCLHGDLAIKQDAAGIAMAHVKQYRQAPHNYQQDFQPVVKVDFVTSFNADLGAQLDGKPQPREVKIRWYRQLIFELIAKGFNIGHISMDGYQSTDLLQQMEELGIEAEVFSLDRTMKGYDELKNVLYDGRLDAPYDYITIEELKKLSYTGKKCDHLPGGSKDRSDSVAGAVYWAVQEGGSEGDSPQILDLSWHNKPNADAELAPEFYKIAMEPPDDYSLGLPSDVFSLGSW